MPALLGWNDAVYARDKAAHAQISDASLAWRTRTVSEDLFVEPPFARPLVGRVDGPGVAAVLEIVV